MYSTVHTENSSPVKLIVPSPEQLNKKDISEYNDVEKMVSSIPYNALVPELVNGRLFAKVMCHKINNLDPENQKLKNELFTELLGTFKNNIIETPFRCDYGSNIHLEEGVYMNYNCVFLDVGEVRIGKNTLLAPGVQVYTAGHPIDPTERRSSEFGKPISIGRDCWIGGNVIICPGITIGDGVTVGAGSVVTKNIESYCVVAGVPARVIKRLTPPKEDI
ncbi:maltose O-acetyltransferase [Hydra vulgaris]|uniref:maltose O-acetyltransferase n=1 Tax=Hydra vulgaris TaxID=6087 RepID=UPI00019268CD|nr:maltose O-acetyltransferase [Hydra vulgaris]